MSATGHVLEHEAAEKPKLNIRMIPLDFLRDGTPRNPQLVDEAAAFYRAEFHREPEFQSFAKVWVLGDDNGILGLTGLVSVCDCPLFHIVPKTMDKSGLRIAEAARDLAVWRMKSHLEDSGLSGSQVLIYVSPTVERLWHRFLGRIGAVPANRWSLTI